MLKIGEFSKLTQVSIRMLRYYDEAGLLKPSQIDPFTGYRLYTADQIPALNRIIFLRDIGFNVAEMAIALHQWDNTFITCQLQSKRHQIERTIVAEQDKLSKIDMAIRDIQQEKIAIHYNVLLKSVPSYSVIALRRKIPTYFAEGELWGELSEYVHAHGIQVSNTNFAVYHDQEFREQDVDVEVCASVENVGESSSSIIYRETESVETMACTMVYGPFENIAAAFLSFASWLGQHTQYRITGHNREIVHRGPWNENSPDKYLTEIQFPLERL